LYNPIEHNRYLLRDMPRYNLTYVEIPLWLSRQLCYTAGTLLASSHPIYFYIDIPMTNHTNQKNSSPITKRNVFVGAKVTPQQKKEIHALANQCGMTVSDYLLARAYNYKPKARLTKEDSLLLQNLDNCRADLVNYVSALHGMNNKQRLEMFNRIPFMIGWLQKLGDVAEAVCQFLDSVRVPNNIPSNNQTDDL